jgi:cytoskeletal protein CcmA (bactofilin family)
MFGRKKHPDDDKLLPELSDELAIPAKPSPRPTGLGASLGANRPPASPTSRPIGAEPARPIEAAKHAPETAKPGALPTAHKREAEIRKLIVGREISLSGEITACDRLVVEGSVEANLANCRDIDIAESGLFKGSASIDDAEVRGRFEGTLNVRRRLLIRASGKVTGTVRYGQIEIECGGQISGDIQAQPLAEAAETAPMSASARPAVHALEEAKVG